MSRDVILEPKNGVDVSISQLLRALDSIFPESTIDTGSGSEVLSVVRNELHLADLTARGKRGRLKLSKTSSSPIEQAWLNGSLELDDVVEELLAILPLKDVTCGDEEDAFSWDDDEEGDDFQKQYEERVEKLKKIGQQETKLGIFVPEEDELVCSSIACAPTCYTRIRGDSVSSGDIKRIIECFDFEFERRKDVEKRLRKELKMMDNVSLLGIGLLGISISGESQGSAANSVPDFFYTLSVKPNPYTENWMGWVGMTGGKIEHAVIDIPTA